jgi:hypothetical protein
MSRRVRKWSTAGRLAGATSLVRQPADLDRAPERSPVRGRAGSAATRQVLTLVTAAGLGVDAYVHWQLAPGFDTLTGTGSPHISQGQLFRLEAALCLIAMLLLLLTRHRLAALVAFLIAAGGLGPLPNMYDPVWYPEKTISAIAEAVTALAALCLLLMPSATSDTDS